MSTDVPPCDDRYLPPTAETAVPPSYAPRQISAPHQHLLHAPSSAPLPGAPTMNRYAVLTGSVPVPHPTPPQMGPSPTTHQSHYPLERAAPLDFFYSRRGTHEGEGALGGVHGGRVLRDRLRQPTRGGRKVGHHNYSATELTQLLDIVGDIEPLEAQHWAMVGR